MNSNGQAEAVLSGLGAGRFRLVIRGVSGGTVLERMIDVDGTSGLRVTYDAR